jgi:hypothetical protein
MIGKMVEKLSVPLDAEEVSNGWTEESRLAMLTFFKDLQIKVASQQLSYLGILRGLDHWGVNRGELFRSAAEIDYELRNAPS